MNPLPCLLYFYPNTPYEFFLVPQITLWYGQALLPIDTIQGFEPTTF